MKNGGLLLIVVLLSVAGCHGGRAMPEQGMWQGSVELPEGISVPLRMNLDFSAAVPTGYFLVGDEKTPIPEIPV